MLPISSAAAGAAKKAPLRMAFIYVPNGKHMADWTPKVEGALAELPATLEPLKEVKDKLLVLSGLTLDKARPHGDGPGDHARAMASFLTGRQPRKTHGADIRAGVSVDQVAALKVGKETTFPSLEIGCEGGKNAGNCDSGYSCAYSANLAWRTESTPLSKEVDPALVFERLFGGKDAGDPAAVAARVHRESSNQSILDFVAEDAKQLKAKLGSPDQRKLDEYLSGVRELEQRIQRSRKVAQVGKTTMVRPAGIPKEYEDYIKLMCDLLVLAFQGDLTRVSTFVFANDGSNRSYRPIGVSEGHHDMSHHGNDKAKQEKVAKINRFHVTQLGYLLGKLNAIQEGERTLLDNSMIVYGSGISDGNAHNHDELPILLAGRGAGTLKTGRHLRFPKETPLMNLYLSMLDRVGVEANSVGDSTGRLPGLDA